MSLLLSVAIARAAPADTKFDFICYDTPTSRCPGEYSDIVQGFKDNGLLPYFGEFLFAGSSNLSSVIAQSSNYALQILLYAVPSRSGAGALNLGQLATYKVVEILNKADSPAYISLPDDGYQPVDYLIVNGFFHIEGPNPTASAKVGTLVDLLGTTDWSGFVPDNYIITPRLNLPGRAKEASFLFRNWPGGTVTLTALTNGWDIEGGPPVLSSGAKNVTVLVDLPSWSYAEGNRRVIQVLIQREGTPMDLKITLSSNVVRSVGDYFKSSEHILYHLKVKFLGDDWDGVPGPRVHVEVLSGGMFAFEGTLPIGWRTGDSPFLYDTENYRSPIKGPRAIATRIPSASPRPSKTPSASDSPRAGSGKSDSSDEATGSGVTVVIVVLLVVVIVVVVTIVFCCRRKKADVDDGLAEGA